MIVSGAAPIRELELFFKNFANCDGFPDNYSELRPDDWLFFLHSATWFQRHSRSFSVATGVWSFALASANRWRIGHTVSVNMGIHPASRLAVRAERSALGSPLAWYGSLEAEENSENFVFQTPCGKGRKETMTWQLVTVPRPDEFRQVLSNSPRTRTLWLMVYDSTCGMWSVANRQQKDELHKYFTKVLSKLRTVKNTTLGIQPVKRDMEAAKVKNETHIKRLKQVIAYQDACHDYAPKLRKLEELVKTLRESAEKGYMVSNAFREMEVQTQRALHAGNMLRSKYRLLSADTLEECVERSERALLGKHPSNKDKDKNEE